MSVKFFQANYCSHGSNRGGRYALRRWALSAEASRFPSFLRREATDRLVPRGEGCTAAPAALCTYLGHVNMTPLLTT